MERLRQYSRSLLSALAAVIALLAVVNLVDFANWRLLLNYFLISNFLLFYPYNYLNAHQQAPAATPEPLSASEAAGEGEAEASAGLSRRRRTPEQGSTTVTAYRTAQTGPDTLRSRRTSEQPMLAKEKSREYLTDICVKFARSCLLLILAPAIFLKTMLQA